MKREAYLVAISDKKGLILAAHGDHFPGDQDLLLDLRVLLNDIQRQDQLIKGTRCPSVLLVQFNGLIRDILNGWVVQGDQ